MDAHSAGQLPNTPRTKLALKRVGLTPEDIAIKSLHDFYLPGDLPKRQLIRFRHYEAKRAERISSVLAERAALIESEFSHVSEETKTPFSSKLIDELAEREQKRLAKALHSRLKRREFAEKLYLDRLEKQEVLRGKLESLEDHVNRAEKLKEVRSKDLQTITEARFELRNKLRAIHQERLKARIVDLKTKQSQEEEAIAKFIQSKEEKQSVSNELWDAKLREISDRARALQLTVKQRKDEELVLKKLKSAEVTERKAKLIRQTQLRGEEVTLRLIDALEKKQQMERQEALKRDQIKSLLQRDLERAHLLELTKDQLLEQRKQLALKQRDLVPVRTEPETSPGPTDYEAQHLPEPVGGVISTVKPKLDLPGTIDFETAKASDLPGPGSYVPDRLVDGSLPWQEFPSLSWSSSKKITFVDEEGRAKLDLPGPASYDLPESPRDKSIVTLKRDIIRPKDRTSTVPGPGTYTVDTFTRMEQIMKKFDRNKKLLTLPPTILTDQELPAFSTDDLSL